MENAEGGEDYLIARIAEALRKAREADSAEAGRVHREIAEQYVLQLKELRDRRGPE